jgi:hypothetical protein
MDDDGIMLSIFIVEAIAKMDDDGIMLSIYDLYCRGHSEDGR